MALPLLDIGLFFSTALLAYVEEWQPKELLWGLWFSSLAVGYALILYGIYRSTFYSDKPEGRHVVVLVFLWLAKLFGAGFMIAFFTVHFIGFHLGHGAFLHQLYPLVSIDADSDIFDHLLPYAKALVVTTWPLVIASVLSSRGAFLRARTGFNPMTPYLNVIRMHLLIFFLAAAISLKIDNFTIILVILVLYFFPWRMLYLYIRGRRS